MKRFLISSCIVGLLVASAPAMSDSSGRQGYPPGIDRHHQQDKAMPGRHDSRFLQAKHRDHRYDRDHKRSWKHKGWDRKKHHRHEHREYRGKHRYRSDYRDKHHYRSDDRGKYRYRLDYRGHLPPELRIGRIIHDARVLMEYRRH